MKTIRLFLLLAALLPLHLAARADSLASIITNVLSAAAPPHTSVIFIQCHGLGVGDLSCCGQTNFQTPNLDHLAAGGIRFTDYHSAGADFSQSQAALLTGKDSAFAPGETTVAQRLQQAGYHTGLIGEWTLGKQPWTQGFDEFAGFLDDAEGKNYYSDIIWRFDPFYSYDQTSHQWVEWKQGNGLHNGGPETIHPNTGGKQDQYLPDLLLTAAVNFVRVNQPDPHNHFRPFFLLVNLPAPRTATSGADDFPVPTDAPFTGERWPQAAKNRAALITRLDAGIGRLLEQLKKNRQTNDVALFFTSAVAPETFADSTLTRLFRPNGNFSGKKRAAGPPPLPMILHWPAKFPAGTVSDVNWSARDFAPTVLELALGKPATNFAGASILSSLSRGVQNKPAVPRP